MTYEEYSYRRRISEERRESTTNWLDVTTTIYLTANVWSGMIEPSKIVMVEEDHMDWLEEE